MRFSLLPTYTADSITDLSPELLRKLGIELLMLDFDNTIVPYTTNEPTPQMHAWLEEMAKGEIPVCVVSNSHRDRVKIFCDQYGIACITHANKPFPKGIRQCMKAYGISGKKCALAGDQIYTDTLGARCAGIRAILVKPIHNHNIWLKLRYIAEGPFVYIARKRRKVA